MKPTLMMLIAVLPALAGCDRDSDVEAEPAAKTAEQTPVITPFAPGPEARAEAVEEARGVEPVALEPGPTITDRSLAETRSRIERRARELGAELDSAGEPDLYEPGEDEMRFNARVRQNLAALEDELTRPYAERNLFVRDALSALYDLTLATERLDEMAAHAGDEIELDLDRATRELGTEIAAADELVEAAASAPEAEWPERSAEARSAVIEVKREYHQELRKMSLR